MAYDITLKFLDGSYVNIVVQNYIMFRFFLKRGKLNKNKLKQIHKIKKVE